MITALTPATSRAQRGAASDFQKADHRFTIDGSAELEEELFSLCARAGRLVRTRMPGNALEAILLGGGYGRGEGGVLRSASGDLPYNDLEFYVFVRGPLLLNEGRYQTLLHRCGEELTAASGIDVEFRVISFAKLRRSASGMFYYDLVMGHRWIFGDEAFLRGCEHHRHPEFIPLSEATRLLMNRCSGLLFAKERLLRQQFTVDDADFVGRNIAKAQLALGDVVLTVLGQYHWSCRQRNDRLDNAFLNVPWFDKVKALHREGVTFKLHPRQDSRPRGELLSAHNEVSAIALQVWLWLEHKRLNTRFADAREYALSRIDKCPETHSLKNLAINLKSFRLPVSGLLRYPRNRVLNSLPLLLWAWEDTPDPAVKRGLKRALTTDADSFGSLLGAYQNVWRRFN